MEDNIVVSTNELQILSELDARQFGFIRLTEEAHAAKKTAALKAIQEQQWVCVLYPVFRIRIFKSFSAALKAIQE